MPRDQELARLERAVRKAEGALYVAEQELDEAKRAIARYRSSTKGDR